MKKFASWKDLSAIFLLLLSGSVCAQSLSELLQRALGGEPTYLSAKTGVDVAKARKNQALGAMLPQLTASGATNANDRTYQTRNSSAPPAKDGYNSNSSQINLTQPLWRYSNIAGWQQASAMTEQAERQLRGAEQELLAKLVAAWMDVLAARDGLSFSGQQVDALYRQWEMMKRGAELGANGQPQLEEAKAKLDQAMSDAVTAETDLQLKRAALEQLVGPLQKFNLPYMRGKVELASLTGEKLEQWLDGVETNNPNLLAAMSAFEAAGAEVKKQYGGHLPTLDLVGSYGKNSQAVGGFPGQAGYDIKQGVIGLQLNIPIFSGGTQSAKVDEAVAQKEKARLDIEAARRTAQLNAKQAWYGWHSAYARAQAGVQGIKSALSALAVAKIGTQQGLKTELDVLQAEQQWRAAQRDFRKGRYDQVASYVKLKAVMGGLSANDVAALDKLFVDLPEEAEPAHDLKTLKVSGR